MPTLSITSVQKLSTCDLRIRENIEEAIKITDFTVICGHRTIEEQADLFQSGRSQKKAGDSEHNIFPSRAIDLAPYPIDFADRDRFFFLAGVIKATASKLNIQIRMGCDWNGDGQFRPEKFQDLGHFELSEV